MLCFRKAVACGECGGSFRACGRVRLLFPPLCHPEVFQYKDTFIGLTADQNRLERFRLLSEEHGHSLDHRRSSPPLRVLGKRSYQCFWLGEQELVFWHVLRLDYIAHTVSKNGRLKTFV
jgi:hypothetical protein